MDATETSAADHEAAGLHLLDAAGHQTDLLASLAFGVRAVAHLLAATIAADRDYQPPAP